MNFRKVIPLSLLALAFFTPAASALITGSHNHTTTLLADGNLLVTGGMTDNSNTVTSRVEIYDMASAAWTAPGNINNNAATVRTGHTATLLANGKVLIVGGFNNAGTPQAAAYLYSPSAATWAAAWAATGSLSSARGGHTATLIRTGQYKGNVLICGGRTAGGVTNTCEMYNGADFTTVTVPPMSSQRINHTASAITNGRVFVSGGQNQAGTYLPTNEIYNPENNEWQTVSPLLQGRAEHSAVVLGNGLIMISGGFNAGNRLYCRTGIITDEDCWYTDRRLYGDFVDGPTRQNVGSHGYIDGAEFFDQNGGRVVLSGQTTLASPYRFYKHAAALLPDGSHHIYGGYGSIYPTYFNAAPTLEDGSGLTTTPIVGCSSIATVTGGIVKFQLPVDLSRPVDGRLVNADAFFSKPPATNPRTPSLLGNGIKVFLGYSTATLDGFPVGTLIGPGSPQGRFDNIVQLNQANIADGSLIYFSPAEVTAPDALATAGSISFTPSPLPFNESAVLTDGSVTLPITIAVPAQFTGGVIRGTLAIKSGTIAKSSGDTVWLATLQMSTYPAATTAFVTTPATPDPINPAQAIADAGSITFLRLAGTVMNSSAAISSGEGLTGTKVVSLGLSISYTSSFVNLFNPDVPITYTFDTSTIVVREMIFSDDLTYIPDTNAWQVRNDSTTEVAAYVPPLPVFGQSAILTPAADALLVGGRNCESFPTYECLRGKKIFISSGSAASGFVYIPSNTSDWQELAKLNTKRAFHTSTLLPDNRILTCGGSDGLTTLSSCEMWDPAAKTWSYVGSMHSPRSRHTATLLPNSTVLLTGGAINASTYAINTAEIFDPRSNMCSNTGSMSINRANHTATLLPDGNVLVAGGDTNSNTTPTPSGYTKTAEIYFTTRAIWVPLVGTPASMTTDRAQHTATLLKSGNVMVAGGVNGDGATDTVEIYEFAAQRWVDRGGILGTQRYAHTANLLRDGRVVLIGGSNNEGSLQSYEILNEAGLIGAGDGLVYPRTNHNATLLPNGKVMLTGGEISGMVQGVAESFDPDFPTFTTQGKMTARSHNTTVLTSSGMLVTIGGWNGSGFLDSTESLYFSFDPDSLGFAPKDVRNPLISGGDTYFARNQKVTLLSATTNFHGITEASGGGSGAMNSSQHNPRVYIKAVDRTSGFLTDITTRLYSLYSAGANTDWEKTMSSITVLTPSGIGELPYGYYHMHVAENGQFSNGHMVQVTMPRPQGYVTVPTTTAINNSSATWAWTNAGSPPLTGEVNGYNIYAGSTTVLLGTAAYGGSASFTQAGLASNSEISVMVAGYNMGGSGQLVHSATYYTLPAQPTNLEITHVGFDHVDLTWNPAGNSDITAYEVSVSSGLDFTDPNAIEVYYPFASNYTSTAAIINDRRPAVRYYFRVRATNGRWPDVPNVISDYTTPRPSTITVASVDNLNGIAASDDSINWSWDEAPGADYYNVYAIADSTYNLVWLDSTTVNSYIQVKDSAGLSLHPNASYRVAVEAASNDMGSGGSKGPLSYSLPVHTLARIPALGLTPISVTTTSLTASWILNGNSSYTIYNVDLSLDSAFTSVVSMGVTNSSVTFRDLTPNQLYHVRLTVRNQDGYPEAGLVLPFGSKYTKAAAPKNVTAPVVSMSGVTLTWNANNNMPGTIYQVRGSTHPPIASPPQTPFEQGFSTYASFGDAFTETTKVINGLLTSTTYYFDVTARNGESLVTAPSQTSPAETFTLAGPDNAPSGSVAGTSDPSKTSTITGTLPNGRIVTLSVPAEAFPVTTALAISSSNINRCDNHTPRLLPTISLELFSTDKAQPEAPVTLTFNYTQAESTSGVTLNAANLVLARYNPDNGDCLPLETKLETGPRRITATLNHFSLFQLMVVPTSTDLSDVVVYPNPFYINRGNGFVTIRNLPANTKVRIYTLSGAKVWEGSGGSSGMIIWKGVNEAGYRVASGIYLAAVDSPAGKKIMKIAVER